MGVLARILERLAEWLTEALVKWYCERACKKLWKFQVKRVDRKRPPLPTGEGSRSHEAVESAGSMPDINIDALARNAGDAISLIRAKVWTQLAIQMGTIAFSQGTASGMRYLEVSSAMAGTTTHYRYLLADTLDTGQYTSDALFRIPGWIGAYPYWVNALQFPLTEASTVALWKAFHDAKLVWWATLTGITPANKSQLTIALTVSGLRVGLASATVVGPNIGAVERETIYYYTTTTLPLSGNTPISDAGISGEGVQVAATSLDALGSILNQIANLDITVMLNNGEHIYSITGKEVS